MAKLPCSGLATVATFGVPVVVRGGCSRRYICLRWVLRMMSLPIISEGILPCMKHARMAIWMSACGRLKRARLRILKVLTTMGVPENNTE